MNKITRTLAVLAAAGLVAAAEPQRPLMRDFMGINGHFHFKPDLYRPVVGLVRNYHNMDWDVAQPGDKPSFPRCVNGVNWEHVYGPWRKAGFEISACAQFHNFGSSHPDYLKLWSGNEAWAETYGYQMAKVLGPTKGLGLIHAIEIDNEPGAGFDDALYRRIFAHMATGIRKADPAIRIVTCAVRARPADQWHKNLDETFGDPALLPLFDVINVHTYAELPEGARKHPWDRTFPEDPRSPFLKDVDEAIAWRDRHAPDKKIWVTEFGWDAGTEEALSRREGWFKKLDWKGVSELDQARYLVRAFLLFARRDVERAYIYFYDDEDLPSVHGSSGITRRFAPKPSYWALSQMQEQLGDFRFRRVVREADGVHVYAFVSDAGQERWVAWSSAPEGKPLRLKGWLRNYQSISVIPMATGPEPIRSTTAPETLMLTGSIVYLHPPE